MTQHSSLKGGSKEQQHRSVLKRYERLKYLVEKGEWDEDKSSIYGLPKIRLFKFKAKKEKPVKPQEEEVATQDVSSEAGKTEPQTEQKKSTDEK